MPEPRTSIHLLIADDNVSIRDLLQGILESAGYTVTAKEDGVQALAAIKEKAPDLVLLDVEMPEMTGWEVVQHLRKDPVLQSLPVLFLTSKSQMEDRIQGLDLGADDYLTKPFNVQELLARVRNTLKRHRIEMESNPLSQLPGNVSIERAINERIQAGVKFTVLYADLNNFKAFNDRYGFQRGDRIIQETAKVLLAARAPDDFVGHIGGDDFIIVTNPDRAEAMCQRIIRDFDAAAPSHYDPPDRSKGYIEVADRQGNLTRFPLVGIAIGGVTNQHRPITAIGQISAIGAEMKKFAKRTPNSSYAIDRRID